MNEEKDNWIRCNLDALRMGDIDKPISLKEIWDTVPIFHPIKKLFASSEEYQQYADEYIERKNKELDDFVKDNPFIIVFS